MSEETNIPTIQKLLYDLFKYTFISNCQIEEESVTNEELVTLTELDIYELIENLKDIVVDLLNFKREYRQSDSAALITRCNQFEMMLQKLEAEVRQHISIEHQLNLHLENTKVKVDFMKRQNTKYATEIEELKERVKQNQSAITQRVGKSHSISQSNTEKIQSKEKLDTLGEQTLQKLADLQGEFKTIRSNFTKQNSETEKLRKNYEKVCKKLYRRTSSHKKILSNFKAPADTYLLKQQTVDLRNLSRTRNRSKGRGDSPSLKQSQTRRENWNSCDFDVMKTIQQFKKENINLLAKQRNLRGRRKRNLSCASLKQYSDRRSTFRK